MLAVSLLSGCTFISNPVSRMKTPRLPSDKASLMTAINAMMPAGASLIRPKNDDESSIRTADLNNDGIRETLVFYETPGEAVQLHGMILESQGDTWARKLVFDGEGSVLESLELKDLTMDGMLDIIVGYSRGDDSLQKALVIYRYDGGALTEMLTVPYNRFVIHDLNGDGVDDITVVSLKRNEYATISVYQYDDGFKEIDKLDLDTNVSNYYNIVAGKVAEGKEGIVLDASINSHSGYSYMMVMESNQLRMVLPGDSRTFKDMRIPSEDIDGDGIIEIGRLEAPPGWEYFESDAIPWFYTYYKWDGKDGLEFAMQQYRDPLGQFVLPLPKEEYGNITLDTKSQQQQFLRFILSDTGETVAEIAYFTPPEWERAKKSDWELWGRSSNKIIAYRGKLMESNMPGNRLNPGGSEIERMGRNE